MVEDVRRINLRFTPEDFDKLDEKRFRSRLSFQELGARLFHNWLVGEGEGSSLRKPANPLLETVAIVQARGDKGLLALLQKAADVCLSVIQNSATPEELAHLKAVAYGEAQPAPKPKADQPPARRGRPRKLA